MTGAFSSRYSDREREAAALAFRGGVREGGLPSERVMELAAAGELEHDGVKLPAFEIADGSTVRDWWRKLKDRLREQPRSSGHLEDAPHRDAIERLRRRMVATADAELAAIELQIATKPGTADMGKLREIARLVREIAALPGPQDPQPPAPGAKRNGERHGGETRGGLGGTLLQAHRASSGPAMRPEQPAVEPPADPRTPEPEREPDLADRMREQVAHLSNGNGSAS